MDSEHWHQLEVPSCISPWERVSLSFEALQPDIDFSSSYGRTHLDITRFFVFAEWACVTSFRFQFALRLSIVAQVLALLVSLSVHILCLVYIWLICVFLMDM